MTKSWSAWRKRNDERNFCNSKSRRVGRDCVPSGSGIGRDRGLCFRPSRLCRWHSAHERNSAAPAAGRAIDTGIEPHHGAEATTRRHPDRHGGAVQNHPQADRAADGCGSREGAQSDSGDSNARAETEIRGFSEAVGRREKEKRAVAGAETQSVQTLTISFPMLPPVKSMLMASGDFSRPSMMVSRSLSFPNIFHWPSCVAASMKREA